MRIYNQNIILKNFHASIAHPQDDTSLSYPKILYGHLGGCDNQNLSAPAINRLSHNVSKRHKYTVKRKIQILLTNLQLAVIGSRLETSTVDLEITLSSNLPASI